MKQYQAVIFDLDGTLLNTLTDLWQAVHYITEKYGYPERSPREVRAALGNGLEQLLRLSLPELTEPRFQALLGEFREYYVAHCNEATAPYPGILELLGELKQRGLALAIVSNKAQPAVTALCQQYFSAYIQTAIGESRQVKRKPAPDTVLLALRQLGVQRQQAVYVGDSEVDSQTARNAGLDCFLVSWGFRDRQELEKLPRTRLVDRPEEIAKLV
ncbi:HAD-IIIA family hydrolase [Acidaminococcus sp. AM05-11]|jgi:phosphoglycolate phosphatase|uniref:HAD family hydrolase n=1 Tax=Acidaminococcus sp. AM05-11 TaxID=2291997 RepID=UPI000E47EB1E|nr:HAD-IIIA family hydrolase [Acidaminococcus sp. AM05-11]RHK02327.1 HAD-IIIA family hydrolase [Acidaminococcus sp. AM05-11]